MRRVLIVTMCAATLLATGATARAQQTFDVTMTADNVYAIYHGDSVSAVALLGNATNLLAADIWSTESYSLTLPDLSFVYIAAWSDDSVKQGLLADFTNLTLGGQVLSGEPLWEVTATGQNLGNWDAPPSLADLTAQIVLANAGSNPSGGWVPNTPSVLNNGAGGIHPQTIGAIDPDARWMWYDSGGDGAADAPFNGFDHDEYLIFRIPVNVPEPTALAALTAGWLITVVRRRGRRR